MLELLGKIESLVNEEILNAQNTIPLVEKDSRLGWEPRMEYKTDRRHIEWKIRHMSRLKQCIRARVQEWKSLKWEMTVLKVMNLQIKNLMFFT